MTESDLQQLINDIIAVQQMDGFGSAFKVSLAKPEQFDALIVRLPYEDTYIRALAEFETYPDAPRLRGYDEQFELCRTLVGRARHALETLERPVTLPEIVQALREAVNAHRILQFDEAIVQVKMPQAIYEKILADYFDAYHPNEYAYVCSGVMVDGVVEIESYYAGEMLHSTAVYSENTEDFNERIVYEEIPHDHNIIIWGHVHPIEQPSWTDITSFVHLAEWDRAAAEQGVKDTRSVALLISSNTRIPSFFDVHAMAQIPHLIEPSP